MANIDEYVTQKKNKQYLIEHRNAEIDSIITQLKQENKQLVSQNKLQEIQLNKHCHKPQLGESMPLSQLNSQICNIVTVSDNPFREAFQKKIKELETQISVTTDKIYDIEQQQMVLAEKHQINAKRYRKLQGQMKDLGADASLAKAPGDKAEGHIGSLPPRYAANPSQDVNKSEENQGGSSDNYNQETQVQDGLTRVRIKRRKISARNLPSNSEHKLSLNERRSASVSKLDSRGQTPLS